MYLYLDEDILPRLYLRLYPVVLGPEELRRRRVPHLFLVLHGVAQVHGPAKQVARLADEKYLFRKTQQNT